MQYVGQTNQQVSKRMNSHRFDINNFDSQGYASNVALHFNSYPHSIADFSFLPIDVVKDKDYCPIEIIKGLTDKGQFQYLTKLMGPQEGTYLYATQFHSLR